MSGAGDILRKVRTTVISKESSSEVQRIANERNEVHYRYMQKEVGILGESGRSVVNEDATARSKAPEPRMSMSFDSDETVVAHQSWRCAFVSEDCCGN